MLHDAVEAPDDVEELNRAFEERRWSDSLPMVLPTRERVAALAKRERREQLRLRRFVYAR